MTIIADAFNRTDTLVTNFVTGGYAALANELSGAIYAGFTLYVMVMGLAYLRGSHHFHVSDMALRLMKGGIIVMLATQWGVFSTWVYTALQAIFNNLGGTLLGAFGVAGAINGNLIENGFLAVMDGATALMSRVVGWPPDIPALLSGIFLMIGGTLLYGYAAFIMLFSKIAFAITVVLAPVFIPFAMFEATRDILGSWVRTVGGFVLIPVLATGVNAFAMSVMDAQLTAANTGNINLSDAGLLLFMCVAFALIMMQVPTIAGGMMGTVGVSGAAGMAKMFMNPLARGVTGASYVGGKMRDRAAERWGSAVERGRARQRERMRARQRQAA